MYFIYITLQTVSFAFKLHKWPSPLFQLISHSGWHFDSTIVLSLWRVFFSLYCSKWKSWERMFWKIHLETASIWCDICKQHVYSKGRECLFFSFMNFRPKTRCCWEMVAFCLLLQNGLRTETDFNNRLMFMCTFFGAFWPWHFKNSKILYCH